MCKSWLPRLLVLSLGNCICFIVVLDGNKFNFDGFLSFSTYFHSNSNHHKDNSNEIENENEDNDNLKLKYLTFYEVAS